MCRQCDSTSRTHSLATDAETSCRQQEQQTRGLHSCCGYSATIKHTKKATTTNTGPHNFPSPPPPPPDPCSTDRKPRSQLRMLGVRLDHQSRTGMESLTAPSTQQVTVTPQRFGQELGQVMMKPVGGESISRGGGGGGGAAGGGRVSVGSTAAVGCGGCGGRWDGGWEESLCGGQVLRTGSGMSRGSLLRLPCHSCAQGCSLRGLRIGWRR